MMAVQTPLASLWRLFICYTSAKFKLSSGPTCAFSFFHTVPMSSPPPSPLRMTLTVSTVANAFIKFRRAQHDALDFASGIPITDPSLCGEDATCKRRVPLEHADRYVCKGAVDVAKLLRGSRTSLLEKAVLLGANVLVEERWVLLSLSPLCFASKLSLLCVVGLAWALLPLWQARGTTFHWINFRV